jgi:hypothetical protein
MDLPDSAELRCTICEGSDPHIGIAPEATIFPEADPIARIHLVFGIDQILQSLEVDFPSGLLHRFGDTQQFAVRGILLCPLLPDFQASFALGLHVALLAGTEPFDFIISMVYPWLSMVVPRGVV